MMYMPRYHHRVSIFNWWNTSLEFDQMTKKKKMKTDKKRHPICQTEQA